MAENAGSIYAEIRLQLDALSKDVNSAKNKFANLGSQKISPEIRLEMNAFAKDIGAAKNRLAELSKLKVHPPEARLEIGKLDGDIKAAKKQIKEFSKTESPSAEVRLAMEKLEEDVRVAREKKKELGETKIFPPEVRLEVEKLEGDISAAKEKLDSLKARAGKAMDGMGGGVETLGSSIKKTFADISNMGASKFAAMAQKMQKAIKGAPIVAGIMLVLGAVKKLISAVDTWISRGAEAYQAHARELAKMRAVLASTGAAAWTSTRQLAEQAKQLEQNTRFAQNEIMQMQSVLLGFRSVTGEVFDEAARAIADMATVLGGDLAGAAQNVGRALESPYEGIRVLARQGVIFTNAQKEMIRQLTEAGDKAAAQRIILDEMAASFGGAAQAVGEVTAAQDRLNTAEERLERARGERNRERMARRDSRRAARREERAEIIELQNAVRDAARRQADGYREQAEYAERLREKLSDVTDEWGRITLEDRIARVELETNLQQKMDQATLLEDQVRRLEAAEHGRANRAAQGARAELEAISAVIAGYRERIETHGALAAENSARIRLEMDEMQRVADLRQRVNEIEERRVTTLEEIERLRKIGMFNEEQAAQARLSAFQAEANAINSLQTLTQRLRLTTQGAREEAARFGESLASGLQDAANQYTRLFDAIAEGNQADRFDTDEFVRRRIEMENVLRRQIITINSLQREGFIDEEEQARQVYQARQAMVASLLSMMREYGAQAGDVNRETTRVLREQKELIEAYVKSAEAAAEAERYRASRTEASANAQTRLAEKARELELIRPFRPKTWSASAK